MKLNKVFFAAAALSVFTVSLFALDVNKNELETVAEDAVVFENYSGPHSVINTADEISSIGSSLGDSIKKNLSVSGKAGSSAKYQVIHAIDETESGKLDADIIVIGSDSAIDHINNVRRVIAAYLTTTYGYSASDAKTVATFVTVYNAVYRGNLTYFNQKYKKVVTDNLTSDKAGIALSYRDWPGKTQLVIPLNDINGGLSTVDTSVISDKQVVKSMQDDEDKGVSTRKEMVDIKEREADKAQEKADAAQKKATEETSKLKEEQKKQETTAQKAQETKKAAEEAEKKAQENPSDKKAQKEAAEKKAEAEEAQKAADEQAKVTQEQAKKTEEAKEEAAAAQATADTKRTEAQNERTTIAQDQQTVVRQQTENASAPTVYGLKSVDELGVLSELVKVNADTGAVIKESPVTVIRSRTVYEAGDSYIAIAGTNIKNGTVKLVLLDKDNMEITKESNETIAETSVLVEDGGNYYCVIKDGSDYFVGKFNGKAENLLRSPVKVKAATPITVTSKGLIVTNSSNKPVLLKTTDLTQVVNEAQENANYNAK